MSEHRPVSLAFDRDGLPFVLCLCGDLVQVGTITGRMYFEDHVRLAGTLGAIPTGDPNRNHAELPRALGDAAAGAH